MEDLGGSVASPRLRFYNDLGEVLTDKDQVGPDGPAF